MAWCVRSFGCPVVSVYIHYQSPPPPTRTPPLTKTPPNLPPPPNPKTIAVFQGAGQAPPGLPHGHLRLRRLPRPRRLPHHRCVRACVCSCFVYLCVRACLWLCCVWVWVWVASPAPPSPASSSPSSVRGVRACPASWRGVRPFIDQNQQHKNGHSPPRKIRQNKTKPFN